MKTDQLITSLSTSNAPLYVCGRCKRSLSAGEFYMNKKTGRPGNYCKECRKAVSRHHRSIEKEALVDEHPHERLIITRIADPTLRNSLILQALQAVAASIERRKQKLREAEAENFE